MDAREQSAALLSQVRPATVPVDLEDLCLIAMAIKRHLDAIDEDLQKLRKELRTRNETGGESG